MAAITRLHITFGLVSIPVSIHSATERRTVPLHQVHAKDGARIRQRRICEAEGVEGVLTELTSAFVQVRSLFC